MPLTLTPEAVAALAPDPASLKAGQKLTAPAKWPVLTRDGDVVWGEAQGSGAHPYLVAADLRTPDIATKCSCPSRKFPCKHALGLLLLHASGAGNWKALAVPEALGRWLEGRLTVRWTCLLGACGTPRHRLSRRAGVTRRRSFAADRDAMK